jgi:hypothetical protein
VLILEHDPLADLAERDAFFGGGLDPGLIGHGMTAIALISIR